MYIGSKYPKKHFNFPNTIYTLVEDKIAGVERFNVTVVKGSDSCTIPDMSRCPTAFQECPDSETKKFDLAIKHSGPINLAHLKVQELVRSIQSEAWLEHSVKRGPHPTTILIDLPCTLFMLDTRFLLITEDVANQLAWAPRMLSLAAKVGAISFTSPPDFSFNFDRKNTARYTASRQSRQPCNFFQRKHTSSSALTCGVLTSL